MPWRNSVEFRCISSLKSASTSLAKVFIISARMSLSENTAAKRRVAGLWARTGKAAPATSAAPLASSRRRAMDGFMGVSFGW